MDAYFFGVIFILVVTIIYGLWIFCDHYFFIPQRNNRINRIINNNNNNNVVEIPPTYDVTINMPFYNGNESPPPPPY